MEVKIVGVLSIHYQELLFVSLVIAAISCFNCIHFRV